MIINTGSRTDIPAFFHKWFLNRIEDGSVCTKNPYNNDIYKYPLDSSIIDCLCFCTKNPKNLLKNIDRLENYNQFWFVTITPYGKDVEANVPSYKKVINTFKELSETIGVNKISWRYDPIFINEKYTLDYHIEKFTEISDELSSFTNDCTISFIDLYSKVKRNFPSVREVTMKEQLTIGEEFSKIAAENNILMKTCVEGNHLEKFGFDCTGCMTQKVIENAIGNNLKIPKGKYRIRDCDCIFGRDIGAYNTCLHGCKYCYANSNMKLVKKNQKLHNPESPLLIGDVDGEVREVREPSYIETHEKVLPLTRTFQSTLL